jgi:hypothetical protein
LHNRKDFSGVFRGLWYPVYMIKNEYSTKEINQLGHPYFVGINLRVWRITNKRGTYEIKAHRVPYTDFWNVNQKKLR